MITVSEALEILRREVEPREEETVPLARAYGRILARDLAADEDFPAFATTAMDGHAIRFGAQPGAYRLRAGVSGAGRPAASGLEAGEAVRVMTGAPVPEGTDAVVPLEETDEREGRLLFRGEVRAGAHLRRRGEIFRRGERLLPRGARLTPEAILLAATVGADPLPVFRLPRCAVAVTGDEIVPAAASPGPGQIRNGNGPALLAALARRGVAGEEVAGLPDRRADLEAFFGGLGKAWDLVVTTGGVSRGDFDHTAAAAAAAGFEILFHGVAVKPGKPVAFGRKGETFWLGLPGNPVSSLVTFEVFGGEALARMMGRSGGPVRLLARLRSAAAERGEREVFRDCRLAAEGGELLAEALPTRGSHDILVQAGRNALLRLPPGEFHWEQGSLLECLPLESLLE